MEPILLLDIDGVCLPMKEPDEPSRFVVFDFEREIRVEEDVVFRVQKLFEVCDVTWCTAWEADAEKFARSLWLPLKKPFIAISGGVNNWAKENESLAETTWKLPAVESWDKDSSRPLIWIDDDLFADSRRWAEKRPGPTLLIQPDPEFGLTDDHVQQIEAFVAENK